MRKSVRWDERKHPNIEVDTGIVRERDSLCVVGSLQSGVVLDIEATMAELHKQRGLTNTA